MTLRPNPKTSKAATRSLDEDKVTEFVQGATSTVASGERPSTPILELKEFDAPWEYPQIRPGKLQQVAARLPEEIIAMLDWLSNEGHIKSKMSFMAKVVSEATRERVEDMLKGNGMDGNAARKLAKFGKQ
jgi:hypothetical protein|tara:strand:- start:75 stop:464 length:390 start_codon:yes stop_codon:yes gene_type:complete